MASWEVVSPHLTRGIELTRPKALGVFWDIENCNVPNGKSAIAVCEKIRAQSFFLGHREIQFAVVCDVTREHKAVLEDLDKAQVDILHVGSNRKNAADDKLKQLMRRFADLHRDGSRIVLISGDMDFAADIADFKRRMFLSVILLHSPNASESLINAASAAHNFHTLLSAVPSRVETVVGGGEEATIAVSNLPSIADCPEEVIRRELTDIARRCNGVLKSLNVANGSAVLRFSSMDHAGIFKQRYIHHKIQNRSINVHWGPRNRGKSPSHRQRCKSFSQSPGPAVMRPRAYSESERKHSSEEAGLVLLSSSQDSNPGDVVVEDRGGLNHHMAEESRGLHPSMGRLSLRARHASESSLTADMSSQDEGQAEKAGRRAHAKIKSRLKLKNRKKSEATPQFLGRSAALAVPVHPSTRRPERNRVLQEQARSLLLGLSEPFLAVEQLRQKVGAGDLTVAQFRDVLKDSTEFHGGLVCLPLDSVQQLVEDRMVRILTALPTQAIRLDLASSEYSHQYNSDLSQIMDVYSLPSLPLLLAPCPSLAVLEQSGEPLLTLLSSNIVSSHMRQVCDLLQGLQTQQGLPEVPLQVLEQEWSLVSPAPLHLPLVARRGEVQCRGGQARLAPALLQGYALHTLLTSMGGVAPLASLHSQHPEVSEVLDNLDSVTLLVRRKGGAVMLEELYRQLGEGGAPPDIVPAVGSQERRLSRLLRGGTPAARSLRQEQMFQQGRPTQGQEPKLVVQVASGQAVQPKKVASGHVVLGQVASGQVVQPKLSLSSFVGPEVQRWRESQEGPRHRMTQQVSPPPSPQRSSTPGDIITIEDSDTQETPSPRCRGRKTTIEDSDSQEPPSPRPRCRDSHEPPSPRPRDRDSHEPPSPRESQEPPSPRGRVEGGRTRRTSRLAANFSGSEH